MILLYPLDAADASENIDAIRETYKGEFEQQSVLRTDNFAYLPYIRSITRTPDNGFTIG
ncbi:MAG: DUF3574 domain-containing protein [Gammaproteobacteria bacterium]